MGQGLSLSLLSTLSIVSVPLGKGDLSKPSRVKSANTRCKHIENKSHMGLSPIWFLIVKSNFVDSVFQSSHGVLT